VIDGFFTSLSEVFFSLLQEKVHSLFGLLGRVMLVWMCFVAKMKSYIKSIDFNFVGDHYYKQQDNNTAGQQEMMY
jgi:hypothetical protein